MKPVIAVDFDDVIAEFGKTFIWFHNRYYGTALTFEDAVEYDLTITFGTDRHSMVRRVSTFVHEYHNLIPPLTDVHHSLRRLAADFELHLVTNRQESTRAITHRWLSHHGLDHFAALHFTNAFGTIEHIKRTKLEVCQEIGATLLIDDAPENARAVSAGSIPVLLMMRPWNMSVSGEYITPVSDWTEAVRQISEHTAAAA